MVSKSAYGSNPHTGANRNNAQARGWGRGWPNAQPEKMKTVRAAGVAVSVRREVAELVEVLLVATEELGYNVKPGNVAGGGTWGFADRPIRGTRTPSNHSWGLAVDINSSVNPMQSTFRSDIPPAVVKMWEACGWYWGGRYTRTPDTMHFEYLGKPSSVEGDLAKARGFLKVTAPDKPKPGKLPEFRPGLRILTKGDRGTDVALLQRYLNLPDKGTFDDALADAVKRYQRMRGYEQDAAVGPITWGPILHDLGL